MSPLFGGLGTMLAAFLLLRRKNTPGAWIAWVYLVASGMALTILTIIIGNLLLSDVIDEVAATDVYTMHILYGFWLILIGFIGIFLAGTGMLLWTRLEPKKSRRKK